METILGITVFCFSVAAYSVFALVREARKMRKKEDPVPFDDLPGVYDDVQYCERPFIEML